MDDVVACHLIDEKSKAPLKIGPGVASKNFRFVYYNGSEFKSNYLEAKSTDEASMYYLFIYLYRLRFLISL